MKTNELLLAKTDLTHVCFFVLNLRVALLHVLPVTSGAIHIGKVTSVAGMNKTEIFFVHHNNIIPSHPAKLKDTILVMTHETGQEVPVSHFLFRPSFQPPASQNEEQERSTRGGGFPSEEMEDYVFADESQTDESSYDRLRYNGVAQLDVVREESSAASTDAQISQDREPSLQSPPRGNPRAPLQQLPLDSKTNATSSSGVSELTYPYALLYNNLAKTRDEQESQRNNKYSPSRLPQAFPTKRRSKGPTADAEASSNPFKMLPTRAASEGAPAFGPVTPVKSRGPTYRQCKTNALREASQPVGSNPSAMLRTLFVGIEQKRHMHRLAAQHMHTIQTWFLFAPSISLTLFTGIIVFVFETTLKIDSDGRVYAAIIAGISAFLSAFWQALNRQLSLGTQGALHESCAVTLQRLSEDVLRTVSSTAHDDSITAEYVTLVREKFEQVLDACPSTTPYVLESSFAAVSHRLNLMLNPPMGKTPRKKRMQNLEMMRLYANAFDELSLEIIHYWAWPIAFPQPRKASEAALRNFTLMITEGRRSNGMGWLRMLFPCWKKRKPRKNLYDIIPTASSVASIGDQSSVYHTPSRTPTRRPNSSQFSGVKSQSLGEEV